MLSRILLMHIIQKTNLDRRICIVVTYNIIVLWKQKTVFTMGLPACEASSFLRSPNIYPAWLCNLALTQNKETKKRPWRKEIASA